MLPQKPILNARAQLGSRAGGAPRIVIAVAGGLLAIAGTPALQAQAQQPDFPAAILEGIVIYAASEAPLEGAAVMVWPPQSAVPELPQAVRTDETGTFSFRNLKPVPYVVHVTRTGYTTESGDLVIRLSEGQRIENFEVKMLRAAVVSGRVDDAAGEPVDGARVRLVQYQFRDGSRRLGTAPGFAATATTNDLGEYRLFDIPPGEYYVEVTYTDGYLSPTDIAVRYPALYYPGVEEPSQAVALKLNTGDVREGVDFRLIEEEPGVRVFGAALNSRSGGPMPPAGASITLTPEPNDIGGVLTANNFVGGEFQITNVPPGDYILTAASRGNRSDRMFAELPLRVADSDIDVEMVLMPGATVTVVVEMEDGVEPPPALEQTRLRLMPSAGRRGATTLLTFTDSIELDGVAPGEHRLQWEGVPDGVYVKSARHGERDVLADGLVISSGETPPALRLTFSARAASVSGSVTGEDSQRVPGAIVVLIPEEARRERDDLFQRVETDQNGGFQFASVAPGVHRLLALRELPEGSELDPQLATTYRADFVAVEAEESGRHSVNLELAEERNR